MSTEYKGGIKNGLYHGHGELTDLKSGAFYIGQFKKGLKDGEGVFTYPNNFKYEGTFKKDSFHGDGIIEYADGSSYKGQFCYGVIEGKGIFNYLNGDIYEGELFKGKKDGKGFLKYANGSEYKGMFIHDKREGKGTLKCINGCTFSGEFTNNIIRSGQWNYPCGGHLKLLPHDYRQYESHLGLSLKAEGFSDGSVRFIRFDRHVSLIKTTRLLNEPFQIPLPSSSMRYEYATADEIFQIDRAVEKLAQGFLVLPDSLDYKPLPIHDLINDLLYENIKEKLNNPSLNIKKKYVLRAFELCKLNLDLFPFINKLSEMDTTATAKECHYLFFDTETTGLPKNYKAPAHDLENWPRLVQLAFIGYNNQGLELFKGNRIIKPLNFTIPLDASRIHGITTDRALKTGSDLALVMKEFEVLVTNAKTLVAHNMDFDEKIVGAELIRMGYKNVLAEKYKICTMKSSTNYCKINGPYGYKWPKLSELHSKLFNFEFKEAHDAAADIQATAKCFWKLKQLCVINEDTNAVEPNKRTELDRITLGMLRYDDHMRSEAIKEGIPIEDVDAYLNIPIEPESFPFGDDEYMDHMYMPEDYEDICNEEIDYTAHDPFQPLKIHLINSFTFTQALIDNGELVTSSGIVTKMAYTLFRYAIVDATQSQKDRFKNFIRHKTQEGCEEEEGYPIYISGTFLGVRNRLLCRIEENRVIEYVPEKDTLDEIETLIVTQEGISRIVTSLSAENRHNIKTKGVRLKIQLIRSFKKEEFTTDETGARITENGQEMKKQRTIFKYGIIDADASRKILYHRYLEQIGQDYIEEQDYPIYFSRDFLGKERFFYLKVSENGKIELIIDTTETDVLVSLSYKYPNHAVTLGNLIASIMLAGEYLKIEGNTDEEREDEPNDDLNSKMVDLWEDYQDDDDLPF